jgi:hypothetical protein
MQQRQWVLVGLILMPWRLSPAQVVGRGVLWCLRCLALVPLPQPLHPKKGSRWCCEQRQPGCPDPNSTGVMDPNIGGSAPPVLLVVPVKWAVCLWPHDVHTSAVGVPSPLPRPSSALSTSCCSTHQACTRGWHASNSWLKDGALELTTLSGQGSNDDDDDICMARYDDKPPLLGNLHWPMSHSC